MSLKSAPFYWLVCDNCGARASYGDCVAMSDPESAIDMAAGWCRQDDRHHCPACPLIAGCARCGGNASELPGERDYHCPECWDLPGQAPGAAPRAG